ncbi:MAG: ABC transporter ATP-binding protein [Anaerolineae bacterium]|nr:ABC transporter ATP-binding protein [Anaerolineae bacterium]
MSNSKTGKPLSTSDSVGPSSRESVLNQAGGVVTDRYLVWMLARFIRPFWRDLLLVFLMLIGVTALSLLPPYLIQRAVDGPITAGDLDGLVPYGIIYFASILVLFLLRFGHTYLLQTVGQNALVNLRQALFEHILRQDMRFFNTTPVGQIVARLSNDIEALTELLSTSIVVVASNLVTMIGIIAVMFAINWQLALIGLSVLPIMTVLTVYFRRRIRSQSSLYHRVVGEYLAFINEQFNGMLVVQLFGRQQVSRDEFEHINRQYRDVHMRLRDMYTVYSSTLQLLTTVGLALVLYGGGQGVLAGWASLGMLIAFIQYTRRSFEPIMQLAEQFTQIQTALSAGERIARMLNVEPAIVDPPNPVAPGKLQQAITFDHVTFAYEQGHPVLRDVTLHIQPGQRVAIVGATGAGKTSLAGLLTRFHDVTTGSIRIGAQDVRDFTLAELRQRVTVVPQNPYCFNGTIADNLRLFDLSVTQEQMTAASQAACADRFIEKLPGGYDYPLLPGGANLSQGQRQLLALARALLHSPDSILILDEATSSIDTETEALIQEGLRTVLKNRTSLIIAHRLSTVRDADRIIVMQRGQIVEDGDHDTLLAQDGLYAQLYRRQFAQQGLTSSVSES